VRGTEKAGKKKGFIATCQTTEFVEEAKKSKEESLAET